MTSLIAKIEDLIGAAKVEAVEHFVVSLGKAVLKVASDSPLGVAILGAIKAGEAGTNPVEKIGLGIEALAPTIAKYAAEGGAPALEADVETTARLAIEAVLPQVKAVVTGPLAILQSLEAIAKSV